MSVQVRFCCQLSSDQGLPQNEWQKTFGFQEFVHFEIVAKGLWACIYFLSSNVWLLLLPSENETYFPFFLLQDMRLNLFSTGQLIGIRTPLHKAWYLRQLSLSRDTSQFTGFMLRISSFPSLFSFQKCFVVINSKEKRFKMCSTPRDTYPFSYSKVSGGAACFLWTDPSYYQLMW